MKKPQRDIGSMLDCWGTEAEWDFVSLQELLGEDIDIDASAENAVVIWRSVGRGGHCVCVGPRLPGTHIGRP